MRPDRLPVDYRLLQQPQATEPATASPLRPNSHLLHRSRRRRRHLFNLGQFLVNFGLLELVAHTTPHTVEDGRVSLDERALETLVLGHWPLEATWNTNVSCVLKLWE